MFKRVVNITNLGGRKHYVRDSKSSEELVGYYQTQPDSFWKLLAKENQEQFKRSLNSRDRLKRASEAREIIVGLPDHVIGASAAKILSEIVKKELGVDCIVAIHRKPGNVHAHIILSERELLPEPVQVEEKVAKRNYYYDEKGRQCKKAEAVKTTLKGTVLQEAHTRYFTDKKNFYNFKNLEPLIDNFAKEFEWEYFDIEKHFPQRHIGKNNPKANQIEKYNKLVKEMNEYFDKGFEMASKQEFCEKYKVPKRFGVNKTDEVRECFEAYKTLLERPEREAADELPFRENIENLVNELQETIKTYNHVSTDIQILEKGIEEYNSDDYIKQKLGDSKLNQIERKYGEATIELLDELKILASELLQKIADLKEKIADAKKKLQEILKIDESELDQEQEQDGFDGMIM